MAIGQWKKATERGGKEGRNCRLCGRGGTAALKSASLVVRQSGGGEFSFRSRWRPAIGRPTRRRAGSEQAGTGFDVDRAPAAAAAAPLLLPGSVYFIAFTVPQFVPWRRSSRAT